jgi:hypothetical protein
MLADGRELPTEERASPSADREADVAIVTFVLEHLHPVRGGVEVTCGRCLAHSNTIAEAEPEAVWAKLLAEGWTAYEPELMPGRFGKAYAICPKCSSTPWSLEMEVAKALKRRKRK